MRGAPFIYFQPLSRRRCDALLLHYALRYITLFAFHGLFIFMSFYCWHSVQDALQHTFFDIDITPI